jgi:hypothetical protein
MSERETLSLELKELSAALKRVDQRLQSETAPDPMALNEFRNHVDNVRLTAWTVSELINAQRAKTEPDKVLAFLSAERVRRLDQLVRNLCGDIERRVITAQSYGMHSLFDAIKVLQQRLAQCFSEQPQAKTPGEAQSGGSILR